MAKSNEHVVKNGKAAFYASILPDLKDAALKNGWALGLHGSLANDMDIMAMPWTENASTVETMIKSLSDCFTENPFKDYHENAFTDKPNGRVVYTMSIWDDWYLDINIIDRNEENSIEWIIRDWDLYNDQFKNISFQDYIYDRFKDIFSKYTNYTQ